MEPMKNGFVKVAAATPSIRVADVNHNQQELVRLTRDAAKNGVRVLVFPELALTGATCGDLFSNDTLLRGTQNALEVYLKETADCDTVAVVGLPYLHGTRVYNAAAVCHAGNLLGVVPKSVLTSDARHFAPAPDFTLEGSAGVPFGTDLLFSCISLPSLAIAVEIGEDARAPISPSLSHSAAGATLICHPAAFPETVTDTPSLSLSLRAHTAKTHTAYVSSLSGDGESTTDFAFGGYKCIAENGEILAESTLNFQGRQ